MTGRLIDTDVVLRIFGSTEVNEQSSPFTRFVADSTDEGPDIYHKMKGGNVKYPFTDK